VAIGSRAKYVSLDPNEVLFREGDEADGFYAVEHGGLKATRLSQDGMEQLIALFSDNDSLAARDFLALPGQLAQAMIRLSDGFGREMVSGAVRIEYKLTQSELGAMIGASRENVSRVLNKWKRAGIIARVDGFYHINKRQDLLDVTET